MPANKKCECKRCKCENSRDCNCKCCDCNRANEKKKSGMGKFFLGAALGAIDPYLFNFSVVDTVGIEKGRNRGHSFQNIRVKKAFFFF